MDALDRLTPPAGVGDRVVVRHRLPDGSATDVIGWLESLTPGRIVLRDHDEALIEVHRHAIVVARRAPASRGGRDPLRTSAEDLEQISVPGWAAHREPLGDWTLRAGGGFTGRANSCLAVGDPAMPAADAARRVQSFSAEHGISPRAQVISGSAPERALRELGWRDVYVPTDVLVTRLADLLGGEPADDRVEVSDRLSPAWVAAYHRSRPSTVDPAVLQTILEGGAPRVFAGVAGPAGLIAIGRGHVAQEWLGVASLWTAPEARRQGWAGRVLITLGHWAARRGSRYVYLQVATENEPAHRAYERLGFAKHHSYLYLAPPD